MDKPVLFIWKFLCRTSWLVRGAAGRVGLQLELSCETPNLCCALFQNKDVSWKLITRPPCARMTQPRHAVTCALLGNTCKRSQWRWFPLSIWRNAALGDIPSALLTAGSKEPPLLKYCLGRHSLGCRRWAIMLSNNVSVAACRLTRAETRDGPGRRDWTEIF